MAEVKRQKPCNVDLTLSSIIGVDVSSQLSFEISPGAAVEYVLIDPADGGPNDPTADGSTDTNITVQIEARDRYNNVATGHGTDVTLSVDGSAEFVSGSGVATIESGIGSVGIRDHHLLWPTCKLPLTTTRCVDLLAPIVL